MIRILGRKDSGSSSAQIIRNSLYLGLGKRRKIHPVALSVQTSLQLSLSGIHTSPNKRRSLKLRLLIFSCGELGKQHMQSVKLYRRSKKYCAMVYNAMVRGRGVGDPGMSGMVDAQDLVQNGQDRR